MKKCRPELLLHLPIPRPLHSISPRNIMGSTWWDTQKLIMHIHNKDRCAACGRVHKDGVEAHECYDIDYKRHIATFREIVGLCYKCHKYIHPGYMKGLIEAGEMSVHEMEDIIDRGDKILAKAGLSKEFKYPQLETWSNWRLIFDKKEYKPKFTNYADWRKHYP